MLARAPQLDPLGVGRMRWRALEVIVRKLLGKAEEEQQHTLPHAARVV